jgi:hypothetical protein
MERGDDKYKDINVDSYFYVKWKNYLIK